MTFFCLSGMLLAVAQTSLALPHFTFIKIMHPLPCCLIECLPGRGDLSPVAILLSSGSRPAGHSIIQTKLGRHNTPGLLS